MSGLAERNLGYISQNVDRIAVILKVMGNDKRLAVLCDLATHGERSVGQLEITSGLSQSALSQHLAKMRQHGIVKTRRAAQSIYYSLASQEASLLLDTLHDMLAPTDRRQAEAGE